MNNTQLAVQNQEQGLPAIVMPAVTPEQAVASWKQYEALKKAIATKEDIQNIQGKEFYKKSYWKNVQPFSISRLTLLTRKKKLWKTILFSIFPAKRLRPTEDMQSGQEVAILWKRTEKIQSITSGLPLKPGLLTGRCLI